MSGTRIFKLMAIGFLATAGAFAQAQGYHPGYGTYGAPMSSYLATSFLAQQVANGAFAKGSKGKPAAAPSAPALTFSSSAQPIAPRKLAATYPEASREKAERLFAQMLEGYHRVEQKAGLRRNDLAGAVATFVAFNYFAWRDEPVQDDAFKALVRQMQGALAGVPAVRNASDADKQELYEHLAIVGMFVAVTREGLQKQPDAAKTASMKQAAKGYLEQFLKVDPARIQLGAQGLTVQ